MGFGVKVHSIPVQLQVVISLKSDTQTKSDKK